jgi:hypothetical protein
VPEGLNTLDLPNSTWCRIFRDLLVWEERTCLRYFCIGELVKVRDNRLGVTSSSLHLEELVKVRDNRLGVIFSGLTSV